MDASNEVARPGARFPGRRVEVFTTFLRLGCTAFGGPVAHLGYFRAELVGRRRWLTEADYADIVALCQFLPGPASSQVCVSLGLRRAGLVGGLLAWLGFTAPSAVALVVFAFAARRFAALGDASWLHGLEAVAVAVVAQAVWSMGRSLCPDRQRLTMAAAAAVLAALLPSIGGQLLAVTLGAAAGLWLLPADPPVPLPAAAPDHLDGRPTGFSLARRWSVLALAVFALLVGLLPLLDRSGSHALVLFERFFRAGALVFGGGHVVLPLLADAVVPPGWIGESAFLAGYGATQAVPGPLFTFSAYLGAAMRPGPAGVVGAVLCLLAIYLPSFLLLLGVLPFWERLRRLASMRAALRGVNAAVVGLLLAALYDPVASVGIRSAGEFALALAAWVALSAWRLPPWLVVAVGGALAAIAGVRG